MRPDLAARLDGLERKVDALTEMVRSLTARTETAIDEQMSAQFSSQLAADHASVQHGAAADAAAKSTPFDTVYTRPPRP